MLNNLYETLQNIIQNNEGFYSSIQEINGYSIESFSYRLAGYDMFQNTPHAHEMRWIAFIHGKEITTPQLFTVWYHKFFNYWEGDTIQKIESKKIKSIQDKIDGSLIMFWKLPDGKIIAKSKTSINSSVAEYANHILKNDQKFYAFVEKYLDLWIFPICEYVGPDNRIVLSYETSELILLWMRKVSWEYLDITEVENIKNKEIPHINISKNIQNITLKDLLEKQKEDEGYEGFIVNFEDWYKLKVKLLSYVLKHKAKDSINNPEKLMEICLEDEADDLRALFVDDTIALDLINQTEHKVFWYYNHVVSETSKLFDEYSVIFTQYNSTEDITLRRQIRKKLAIENRENDYFGLIMKKLDNSEINYKEFVRKTIII